MPGGPAPFHGLFIIRPGFVSVYLHIYKHTMQMRKFGPAILLFFSILTSHAQVKKYPSLLWEISGNGLKKISYLYGTMHVSNKLAFHLTDTFFIALKAADMVALESSPDTWMSELYDQSPMMTSLYTDYFGNDGLFGSYLNFYGGFRMEVPNNEIFRKALAEDPDLADQLLYRYGYKSENHEENTYLDLFIFQSAKKMLKPVLSLEDVMRSEELYQLSVMPDEDADYSDYDYNYEGLYGIQDRIEDAYRNGDLDCMDSLTRLSNPSKNFRHYLINERNKIFVHSMDSLMKKGSLFTGVGAAHLPGDSGVIMMLRNMGYTVRPVMAKVTKKSVAEMNKLQDQKLLVSISSFISSDSDFVMNSPGKLYDQSSLGYDQQFYPEMVNGTYYTVRTIVTNARWLGFSREYMVKKIDSLLYENIPGKILSKENIRSNNGFPGLSLTNQTKRGDVQRYRVFVTDNLIYIFKVSSTGDYLKGKEGDKVMNSIRFTATADKNWKKIKIDGKNAEIEMPAGLEDLSGPVSYLKSGGYTVTSMDPADSTVYLVEKRSVHDYDYIEEDTFELRMAAKSFYEDLDYEVVSASFGSYAAHPSYDVKLKNKKGKFMTVRTVIWGADYFLFASLSSSEKMPERFFDSFKVNEVDYTGKLKEYVDTTMHFKVNVLREESASSPKITMMRNFMNKYKDMYKGLYGKHGGRYSPYDYPGFHPESQNMSFVSPLSGEKVWIGYYRYDPLEYKKDKTDFWKTNDASSSLITSRRIMREKNGITELFMVKSDTASTRQIWMKYILKQNTFYSIYACVDSVKGPDAFVLSVFNSFVALEDTAGVDLFTNKEERFFKDLASKDSVVKDNALQVMSEVSIGDKYAGEFLKYMRSEEFTKLDYYVRMRFYDKLGTLNNKEIVPFLKQRYKESSDSTSLQFTILRALSAQQTKDSYTALAELFKLETPLTSSTNSVNDLFYTFYDSLELAVKLFPSFYDLIRYPEYKSNVIDLLATLKDSGIIKPEFYFTQKSFLIKDASEELKRDINDNGVNKFNSYNSLGLEKKLLKNYSKLMKNYYNGMYDPYYGQHSQRDLLTDYAILLAPYYEEENVKKFYEKIFRSSSSYFKINTAVVLLKSGKEVNDSIWKNYSASLEHRIELYRQLNAIRRLDKFDVAYRNQSAISRAMVSASGDYYNYMPEEGSGKDSVVFLGKKFVSNKEGSGYVYFYKTRSGGKRNWYLSYNGYQSADTNKISIDPVVQEDHLPIPEGESADVKIGKIMEKLAVKGRKRAGGMYDMPDTMGYGGDY
jgi:uncharacterized protein YbaP (TraB family)